MGVVFLYGIKKRGGSLERFVVVDLETTGHSTKYGNEIIEIGIVVIENREIKSTFSSKVRPKQKIPTFIQNLTGIDNESVKDAPTFKEIIPTILPFFEDSFFVAHHVQFDYECLNDTLNKEGHGPIFCPTIDTVELSRIFFPRASSYKLNDLATYLNIEHETPHRALSDAYVASQLLIKIIEKIELLPLSTCEQLEELIEYLQCDFSILYPMILEEKRYQTHNRPDLTVINGFSVKKITEIIDENHVFHHDINHFEQFLQQFYSQNNVDLRKQQIEMTQHINNAFNDKENLVIEAGLGIGKTVAYLLPSIYHAIKHHKKILISTNTIQLQEQLMNKDRELVELFLKDSLDIVLLKSPNHYIHLGRLRQYIDQFEEHDNYDVVLTIAMILVWLTETETGDYTEIHLPSFGEEIWPYISGYDGRTKELSGSYFDIVLEKAKNSPIVVVNHAFLLSNLLKSNERLPHYDYLIIDEAHRFEMVARNQLTINLDYVSIIHLLNELNKTFPQINIEDVKLMADSFFRSLYDAILFLHSNEDHYSDTGKIQYAIEEEDFRLFLKGKIIHSLNDLLLAINGLLNELELVNNVSNWEGYLINLFKNELHSFQEQLSTFFDEQERNYIRYIEIDQLGAKNAVLLHYEPVLISQYLKDNLLLNHEATVFTSGTLQTNDSFQTFLNQIGLIEEDTKTVVIPSAYKYEKQARIYVPEDFPDVTDNLDYYASKVAQFISTSHQQLNNKILVLTTSYDMLKSIYEKLRLMDKKEELVVLAQGITSSNPEKLKKMFLNYDQSILIGTNTFWEGFDLNDKNLKTIIMTRLPFNPPNDPLIKQKAITLNKKGENTFKNFYLPEAILRFRQAFGRLIRNEDDQGVLFILDQRIMTKGYGKQFLTAIPTVPIKFDTTDTIINDAKNWLLYHERK